MPTPTPATTTPVANGPHGAPEVNRIRKPRTPIPVGESKRQKFRRVASRRTQTILQSVDVLIKLGRNKYSYEYTNEDVHKIVEAIRTKVDVLEATLAVPTAKGEERFQV